MSESELSSPVVSSVENPEPLCSICLEEVSATCGRTMLVYGTLLYSLILCALFTDCIGSAFNAAGIMQCPNCRQIENGEWLCFETRDSETDMEQHFNQDVEDQEPEMVGLTKRLNTEEWNHRRVVCFSLFGYMAAKKSPCKEARAFDLRCVDINDALVQLPCGAGNVVSIAITNRSGVFSNIAVFPLNLNLSSLLSNCNLVVNMPLSNCNSTLPSVGRRQLPLQFIGNTLLGPFNILNITIVGPVRFQLLA
ncbi:hypothetical protein Dsin_029144 [Dipteronia sinensis]|uniref:Uncharacterized protein n=1 Tax=Dipteronia sinensis TaxID=43782 RepID=A0AAD9ZRT4_9ROSI|nr:hypothetical protein Dsin_029144 [Dipteronia sinensis]